MVALLESITKPHTPDQKNKKGLVETPNKKSKVALAAKTSTPPKVDQPSEGGEENASSIKKENQTNKQQRVARREVRNGDGEFKSKKHKTNADDEEDENVSSDDDVWMCSEGE